MKKAILMSCALALVACGGLNKNTVSYQMGKYDASQYYVVAADGPTAKEASAQALSVMQKELTEHTSAEIGAELVGDLLANAYTAKTWRDKESDTKHYYSLAVLPRDKANAVLMPQLNQADAQLIGLAAQFATPADPLADLKIAYKMQPLVERRTALDELYQFLQADRSSFQPETFAPYKTVFKEKMAAVLVGVDVSGVESEALTTYIVDALNQMGLGVVESSDPDKTLLVQVTTEVDNYSSKKINGLIWCSSSATVSLIDAARDVTFARFNAQDRAGTTRISDSLRRSMQGVGEQAAKQISTRLENYLKTK